MGPGRLKFLLALSLLFLTLSFLRLFQKQVLEGKKYADIARGQQIIKKEMNAQRGKIYVREGGELYPLATNITLYTISVVPKQVKDKKETAKKLASILNLNFEELFEKINNNKPYLPPIARHIDQDKMEKVKALGLKGVMIEEESQRFYPEGEMNAHLLGFVDQDGQGHYGLEDYYDAVLKGEKGMLVGARNPKGEIVSYLDTNQPQNGADLILTIDRTIQFEAFRKLKEAIEKFKAQSGTIIVMEPQTGAILAMVNYPTFDPNQYFRVKNYDLFLNPAISKVWEPGSVFKVIAMAAGIDANAVTKETTEYFPASVTVGGHTIWTFDKKSHGRQNMTQVLETSNNVGMVYVVRKLGKEKFWQYLKNFGFGSLTGIDLAGEVTKRLRPYQSWRESEFATMGFGQGIAVTPIQMVTAVAVIANGGKLVWPHLVDEIVSPSGERQKIQKTAEKQVISPSTAATLTEMMVSVVERGHGKKARVPGFRVAGKTGTAQVPRQDGQGYEEGKTIGSFVGFAPAENPRFVMLVKIDQPQTVEWAESSAAPVFGEMAQFLLNYFKLSPNQ